MEKNPKAYQANRTSGTRTYVQTKGGYVERVRRITDRAIEYAIKEYNAFMSHSEFKKPYASISYDDMEYGAGPPTPPPPEPPWPPQPPEPPEPPPEPPKPPWPPIPPIPPPPQPPIYKMYRCWILPFFYCPGGPPVTIQAGSLRQDDPITGWMGDVKPGGGWTAIFTPGQSTSSHVCAFTAHGAYCCGDGFAKDPSECSKCSGIAIGYSTTSMSINETQTLTASGGDPDGIYIWTIISGGGSIAPIGDGYQAIYTAPSSNEGCKENVTIGLFCDGALEDTLQIAIMEQEAGAAGYYPYCTQWALAPGACVDCYAQYRAIHVTCGGIMTEDEHTCSGTKTEEVCPASTGCETKWPDLCDEALIDCYADPCSQGCAETLHDTRTQAQKDAGCCPPQFV